MKMINHHDKLLTRSESWDQDVFFEPGFGVSSHSNHRAGIFTMLWPPTQSEHLNRLTVNRVNKRTRTIRVNIGN